MRPLTDDLEHFLRTHTALETELSSRADGARVFSIRLPTFVDGREVAGAWLHVPPGFLETQSLEVWLPKSAVLRVPHVEGGGKLCFAGDPGPTSGASPKQRVEQTLNQFYDQFCAPWNQGTLDSHFREEALNYWYHYCAQRRSDGDPVTRLLLLDNPPAQLRYGDGVYLPDKRWVLFGDAAAMERALPVVGANQQQVKVQIADIPIVKPLTPDTWPRTNRDLERLVRLRLPNHVSERFMKGSGKGNRPIHRLIILRAPECSFGFLLPGGPASPVRCGYSWKVQRAHQPLPLPVERLDVSWICGRDQHPEIATRQHQRVLVVGIGALGSFVVEHLVKAGVGHLTLVDSDSLSAANLGRHALGANDLGRNKVEALASRVKETWPAASIVPAPLTLDSWLKKHSLADFDLLLDLTGEPNVRLHLERARQSTPCPLLIGWMEPFAAAAHACLLPAGQPWSQVPRDPLDTSMAINWPADIMLREPGCSSQFQSYTHAAASHAVAMVSEAALDLLDGEVSAPLLRSLVRGRRFLEKVKPGLSYREWSANAADSDSTIWDRPWHA